MVQSSPLAGSIEFFKNFGLFDVVLPFLLIFSIVFAILEKTRILGVEGIDKPKKNINSMVSFVIALFVVASNKVVSAITNAIPNIILLVVVSVCFLLMVGVFAKTGEFDLSGKHPGYYKFLVGLMFVGVAIIFLYAIQTDNGTSWLELIYGYVMNRWGGAFVSSLILLGVVIGAIFYVVKSPDSNKGSSE